MRAAPQHTDSIRQCADNIAYHLGKIADHNCQIDWHREAVAGEIALLKRLKPAEPVRSDAEIRAEIDA